MACSAIQSLLKGCDPNNVGGIFEVYIIDTDSVTATTISASAHTITSLGVTEDFSTFQFRRNVGNFTVEPAVDLLVGSTIFNATLTLQFTRREGSKSRALSILGEGQRFLNIIVKAADGTYSYFDHMQINGGAEESGTVKADGSKYTVTFLGEMDQRPYFVDPAIVAALIS